MDKSGGLPSYIERIAKHLHYEKGMTISHAIATAVNTVKRWCKGGTISKTSGPETSGGVSAATKAKACAAVAQWNAKRAKAALSLGMDRDGYSDEEYAELLANQIEANLNGADEDGLELNALGTATMFFEWDPGDHPRDWLGKFVGKVKDLNDGQALQTAWGGDHGNIVKITKRTMTTGKVKQTVFDVTRRGSTEVKSVASPEEAVGLAISVDNKRKQLSLDQDDEFDPSLYERHLAQERQRLNLGVVGSIISFDWNPDDHPRDLLGRFKDAVAGLKDGQTLKTPDGREIQRKDRTTSGGQKVADFLVKSGRTGSTFQATGRSAKIDSPEFDDVAGAVAENALRDSAKSSRAKSVGGPDYKPSVPRRRTVGPEGKKPAEDLTRVSDSDLNSPDAIRKAVKDAGLDWEMESDRDWNKTRGLYGKSKDGRQILVKLNEPTQDWIVTVWGSDKGQKRVRLDWYPADQESTRNKSLAKALEDSKKLKPEDAGPKNPDKAGKKRIAQIVKDVPDKPPKVKLKPGESMKESYGRLTKSFNRGDVVHVKQSGKPGFQAEIKKDNSADAGELVVTDDDGKDHTVSVNEVEVANSGSNKSKPKAKKPEAGEWPDDVLGVVEVYPQGHEISADVHTSPEDMGANDINDQVLQDLAEGVPGYDPEYGSDFIPLRASDFNKQGKAWVVMNEDGTIVVQEDPGENTESQTSIEIAKPKKKVNMSQVKPDDPIRPNLFALHLARARRALGLSGEGELNLGIVSRVINFDWDPTEHPRDILGQFRKATKDLKDNDTLVGSDGTSITRESKYRYKVHPVGRNMGDVVASTPKEAADAAITSSARNATNGKSVGGAKYVASDLIDPGKFAPDSVASQNGFGLVRVVGPAPDHKVFVRKNVVKGDGTETVTEAVHPIELEPFHGPTTGVNSLPPASNAEELDYAKAVEDLAQDVENGYGEGMGQAVRKPSGAGGYVGMKDLQTFELEDLRDYLEGSDNDAAPATLQAVEDELSTRPMKGDAADSIMDEMDNGVIYSTNDLLRELGAYDNTEERRDEAYDLLIEGEYEGPADLDSLRALTERSEPDVVQAAWDPSSQAVPIFTPKGRRIDTSTDDRMLMARGIRALIPDAEAAQRGEFDVVGVPPDELRALANKIERTTATQPLHLKMGDLNLVISGLSAISVGDEAGRAKRLRTKISSG